MRERRPEVVDTAGEDYLPLMRERTEVLRAGRVHLRAGEECGEHTTGRYEELLIILGGEGTVTVSEQAFRVREGNVMYIPPHTAHNVVAGGEGLRYIYVVAPTLPEPEEIDWLRICEMLSRRGIGAKLRKEGMDPWGGMAMYYEEWCRATGYPGPILDRVLSFLDASSRVLEIGPGTGAFTAPIAERVEEVVALEPSPGMREFLTKKLKERGIENVVVHPHRVEEAEGLGEFDLVLAAFSLGGADLREAVRRMNKLSRGLCVIVDGDREPGDGVRIADALLQEMLGLERSGYISYMCRVNALYQMGIRANVEILSDRGDVPWDLYLRHRRARYSRIGKWKDGLEEELEAILRERGVLVNRVDGPYLLSRGKYACIWWRAGENSPED